MISVILVNEIVIIVFAHLRSQFTHIGQFERSHRHPSTKLHSCVDICMSCFPAPDETKRFQYIGNQQTVNDESF